MTECADIPVQEIAPDAVLLDVREPSEWSAGRAPQALHIPLGELTARVAELPEVERIYVICRSGRRSTQAANWLLSQGIVAVNVADGMQAWAAAGLPIVADGASPVVH
jgi:rhodanese-related sulfurtransferase